jgi:hypothetical protein
MSCTTYLALTKCLRCLRVATPFIATVFCWSHTRGGEITFIGGATEIATDAVNNEDYTGAFAGNPNRSVFNSNVFPQLNGTISSLEGVFAVVDSGGTSEYALTIQGAYSSDRDPPLTGGYKLEIGFGTGEDFVPASQVLSGLDFDAPLPSDPALPTSIDLFGVFPLFDLVSHEAEMILWSGQGFTGSFFHASLFQVPLDVPDLPISVLDFYAAGDLPEDFPTGVAVFTIRGSFVPEPGAGALLIMGAMMLLNRRYRHDSLQT